MAGIGQLKSRLKRVLEGQSSAQAVAFVLLLVFVASAPFPYGAVTPGGSLKIQLFAFSLAALAMMGKRPALASAHMAIWPIIAIGLLGAFQLLPMTSAAVQRISPTTTRVYDETNQILALANAEPAVSRLSIAPTATVRATLLVFAYVALFVAAVALARTREHRRIIFLVAVVAATLQVLYAAGRQWTSAGVDDTGQPRLHGPFINANHFAGYLEIALPLAFGVLWIEVLQSRRDGRPPKMDRGTEIERRIFRTGWRLALLAILAAGMGLTQSRLGIGAAVVTLALLVVAAVAHQTAAKKRRIYAVTVGAILAIGGGIVALATRDLPLLRFLATDPRDPEIGARLRAWEVSLDAWREFPHVGSGLGTFREAFRRVQPADLPGTWEQAHSDSLQLLVTGGWIALCLAVAGLGGFFTLLTWKWWKHRHREESVAALSVLGALLSLVLHGIGEFNFSIPAIPATLAVILGTGWAAVNDPTPRDELGPVAIS